MLLMIRSNKTLASSPIGKAREDVAFPLPDDRTISYNNFDRTEVTDYNNALAFFKDLRSSTLISMVAKGLNRSSPYKDDDFLYWSHGVQLDLEVHGKYLTYAYLFAIIDTVKTYFDIWQTEKVPTCVLEIKQSSETSLSELVVGCGSISVGNAEQNADEHVASA